MKGEQLDAWPWGSMVFFWRELDRQVRIRGGVERVSDAGADEYFASRPRDSKLGAWASPQSRPLAGRAELEQSLAEVEERFGDGEVPRPPHWGGYRLLPEAIEFWQGQVGRLHDRFRYTLTDDAWASERLAP